MSTPFFSRVARFEWPRAPVHRLPERGAYMITAATYQKQNFFQSDSRRDLLLSFLLATTAEYGWALQAWAVMANHYHFVGLSPADPKTIRKMIGKIHTLTAREINRQDETPGRKVWYQYWDSHITFERSYLARLKYVHTNPVHHQVAAVAENYRWCSAAWFARQNERPFYRTVMDMGIENIRVRDVEERE